LQGEVIILQAIGDPGIEFFIGIMDDNKKSKIFNVSRVVRQDSFAILILLWPRAFFIVPKKAGDFLVGLHWRRRFSQNHLELKWNGEYYNKDSSEIKDLDLYCCPRQL